MMLGNVGLAGLDHVPMQWVFICNFIYLIRYFIQVLINFCVDKDVMRAVE